MPCSDSELTDFEFNRSKYNMSDKNQLYIGHWYTHDLKNTMLNRMIRYKLFYVFIDQCVENGSAINGIARPNIKNDYTIKRSNNTVNEIDYEDFDYSLIIGLDNPVEQAVVNDIWPLLRQMWRVFGAYELDLRFDPKNDLSEFGSSIAVNFTARYQFAIDAQGNWQANHYAKFLQTPNASPWDQTDHSFEKTYVLNGRW